MTRIISLLLISISLAAQELPPDAQKALDAYEAKVAKLRADLDKVIDKEALNTISDLRKAQDAATKKGNLDGAVAIKATIAKLVPKDAPKDEPAQDLKQRLVGQFDYSFPNGHKGQVEIKGGGVTDVLTGIQGTVKVVGETASITWGNNTQWRIVAKNGVLSVEATDGTTTITEVKR